MQLPDEAITYQFQSLLVPAGEDWSAVAELRSKHFLQPARLKEVARRVEQAKGQVAAERELRNVPPEAMPIDSAFIDLPQNLLDGMRRKGDLSDLGRIFGQAARLREQADCVVVLGAGGDGLAGRIFFEALKSSRHNELPAEARMGVPRI